MTVAYRVVVAGSMEFRHLDRDQLRLILRGADGLGVHIEVETPVQIDGQLALEV